MRGRRRRGRAAARIPGALLLAGLLSGVVLSSVVLSGCASLAPGRGDGTAAPGTAPGMAAVADLQLRGLLLLMADQLRFEPLTVESALGGDAALREELARTLGRVGDPRGVSYLVQLLGDPEPRVRRAAAFALGEVPLGGDERPTAERAARALLLTAVEDDPEAAVLAVEALGKLGVSVTEVLQALTVARLPEAERWSRLLPGLWRFDEPAMVVLAEASLAPGGPLDLSSSGTEVPSRGEGAGPERPSSAPGRSGDAGGRLEGPASAAEGRAALRRRAAFALARNPRPEALPRLRLLLADPDPRIRAWAARAVGMIGEAGDLALLAPLVEPAAVDSGSGEAGAARSTGGQSVGDDAAMDGSGPAGAPPGPLAGEPVSSPRIAPPSLPDPYDPALLPAAPAIQAVRAATALVERHGPPPREVVDRWQERFLALLSDPRPHVRLEAFDRVSPWLAAGSPGSRLAALVGAHTPLSAAPFVDPGHPALAAAATIAYAAASPGIAGDMVSVALLDDDPRVRAAAATVAGSVPGPAAAALLETLVADPTPAVRTAAAQALLDRLAADATTEATEAGVGERGTEEAEPTAEPEPSTPPSAPPSAGTPPGASELSPPAAAALGLLATGDVGVHAVTWAWLAEHPVVPYEPLTRALQRTVTTSNPEAALEAVAALAARAQAEPRERGGAITVLEKLAGGTGVRAVPSVAWLVRRAAADALAELGRPAPPTGSPVRRGGPELYEQIVQRTRRPVRVEMATGAGDLVLELDCPAAPRTCLNFVQLAEQGFYDGTVFHRVVPDFVVQGGDPRGDGFGGPGYTVRDEMNRRPYDRGVLGMALAGPHTGGSQFFLTLSPQPHLDGAYTPFGRVVAGDEVLDRITRGTEVVSVRIAE